MIADGYWTVIFRKGKVFVPTMAQTDAGFYVGIEPVVVVDETDHAAIEKAIVSVVEQGNPRVPTPSRDAYSEDVVLKYAGVKSLPAFEKLARTWKLSKRGHNFLVAPYQPGPDDGSTEALARQEAMPSDTPLPQVVRRLLERAVCEAIERD